MGIKRFLPVASAVVGLSMFGAQSATAIVAYNVPGGTVGTQNNFLGSLGLDFNVLRPISIDQLGVFDSGSNGLSRTITAYLYDRTAPAVPLATLVFNPGDPDTVVGGSRFKNLGSAITLPAGFQGSIVAENYLTTEPNGNSGAPVWTTNSGDSALAFVGGGRYGAIGAYPINVDGGPANRYAAGTFNFQPLTIGSGNIPMIQGTAAAIFSQGGFAVGNAVDGNAGTGWADAGSGGNGNTAPNTAVFETISDVVTPQGSSLLTFTLSSGGFSTHTLGNFRISFTTDPRSDFADGLANGGDVTANWTQLTPISATSSNPTTVLSVLGDNSVLASGGIAEFETYTIRAITTVDGITGFRIEMLEHPSLPFGGPGRATGNGNYVLYEFTASVQVLLPEPGTAALTLLGGLSMLRRRRVA